MKTLFRAKALLLCALVLGVFLSPTAVQAYPKSTDRTVVYFGAPW